MLLTPICIITWGLAIPIIFNNLYPMSFRIDRPKGVKLLLLVSSVLIFSGCYEEIEIDTRYPDSYLKFSDIYAGIDFDKGWVLLPVIKEEMKNYCPSIRTNLYNLNIGGREYSDGDRLNLSGMLIGDSVSIYFVDETGAQFYGYLYFTTLPVIQIYCISPIPDEPKVLCDFILSDNTGEKSYSIFSKAGIELRGRSALSRPKKCYGIELWEDESGIIKRKEALLSMRKDDDWILDAMYIDKSRMRNKVSMELWKDICASSRFKNVYGKPYTQSKFIELFLNSQYKGLYCISERYDRKQLDLTHFDGSLNGVLYKSESWTNTTKFTSLADTSVSKLWDGWEQKYPDPEEYICWRPLYNYADFVIHSSDSEFIQEFSDYHNLDNLIDYFLFINISCAFDNMGINMIYARRSKNSCFVIYPWDLDATWGRNWNSTYIDEEYLLSNRMFNRFFELNVNASNPHLQMRWNELRQKIITHDNLMSRFIGYYHLITESGAINREKICWSEMSLDLSDEMAYIDSWLENRIQYLDDIIQNAENIDWEKNGSEN